MVAKCTPSWELLQPPCQACLGALNRFFVLSATHCDAQTQKPADLKPGSLSSSPLEVIMCQSRTSLHRDKCGDSSVKCLTGVPLQASKESLSHWNWTLSHTWAISGPGLVWLRMNLFIAKMTLPLLCAGNTVSFKVYHNKMMLFFSVCVLPVLCLALSANRCHLVALQVLNVFHLTYL